MTVGSRAGTSFLLDPNDENKIGRGTDCAIVLTDPLCSRVHAIVSRQNDQWQVRDADSRNGTFVNDQKTEDAVLGDGHRLRFGSTEFSFHLSDQPPTVESDGFDVTQTLIKNQLVGSFDNDAYGLSAVTEGARSEELLLLYQFSIKLLGCTDPDDVMRIGLELLADWTKATVAAFLWVSEDGTLKTKLVVPADAAQTVTINKSLTEMVCRQGNAVWIANQKADRPSRDADGGAEHFADALCVPLVNNRDTLGAIHLYLESGRFRQSDFDFAISLVNIAAVALVRARRELTFQADYQQLVAKTPGHGELVGNSAVMRELRARVTRLARATGCVLIRGESGTGKELVARALHRASPRADRPMLSVNCAAISGTLMESQLFGHKSGAFTGAERDHAGYFQQADSGTLFLDEVGELTLEGQAKLLRILEGHPFLPVGATTEVTVDVRVIAATNQDLHTYVSKGRFREDLYYRLTVFELDVPPLRNRGEDIGLLIDFFLNHFRRQHGRLGIELSAAARERLLSYSWPGNVRQLRNVLDSAVVLAEGTTIEAGDLGMRETGAPEREKPAGAIESLKLEDWEHRLIRDALDRSGGNVPQAARLLGIGRATLYRKIEQYGLTKRA